MSGNTSQIFESYVPVYDAVPDKWEEARPFIVEILKKVSNAINAREIGWFLDEELISGKQFIPSTVNAFGTSPSQSFRSILRKCFIFSTVAPGTKSIPHGVAVDANFTLIDLWGSGTDSGALTGSPINQPNIYYDVNNIYVVTTVAYTTLCVFFEFCQES